MKAVLIHQFGDPDVLRLESVAIPEPAAGGVLVRVYAVGINPVDWQTRAGLGLAGLKDLPLILGFDLSGEIAALGAGVTRFKVGDQVYGLPYFPEFARTYAEYAVAPESNLAFKPRNLSHIEAAALPLAGLTALQALEVMKLQVGQTLLIDGADGGVGHLAAQLAQAQGAQVIGTTSSANEDLVRVLGAVYFDRDIAPFEGRIEPVDAALDTLGGGWLARSIAVVKSGGLLVSIAEDVPIHIRQRHPDIRTERIRVRPSGPQLEQLASLIEDGQLRSIIRAVFPLEEVVQAHRLGQQPDVAGQIVLEVRARPP